MIIDIKAINLEVDTPLRDRLNNKLQAIGRFVKKFEAHQEIITTLEITKESKHHKKGQIFQLIAKLHLPGKKIVAEHHDSEIVSGVDSIKDILKRELIKHKEKLISHKVPRRSKKKLSEK